MDINSESEDEIAPASAEKENAAATSGTLGPCKSQQGYAAAAAAWPSGTAAWVSRKSHFFPVVTGGYRDKPDPDKPGLVRLRYVSVKDKHRTIDDVIPSRLRSWDDVNARAVAARQAPSANYSAALVAIVQRVADGEDADAVLSATREQQQQQQPLTLAVELLLARRTKAAVGKDAQGCSAPKQVQYLVRWQGYGPKDDTWEPSSNIDQSLVNLFEHSDTVRAQWRGDVFLVEAVKAHRSANGTPQSQVTWVGWPSMLSWIDDAKMSLALTALPSGSSAGLPSNSGDATSGPTQALQVQVGALVLLKKSAYPKYRDADLRVRVRRVDVSSSTFDAVPAQGTDKQQYVKRNHLSWKLEGAPLSSIERLLPMPVPSAADSGGKGGKEREPLASSSARADEEGLAEAAEAEEAGEAAEDALPKARRGTGKGTPQSCRRCGQPKRGHLCTNPKQTAEEGGAEEQAWQGAAGRKRGRDGVEPAATRRSWVGLGACEAGASLPGSSGGSGGADGADGADGAEQSEEEEEEEVVVVEEEEGVVVKEEGASVHVGGSGPTPSPQPGPQPGASASASAAEEAPPGSSTAEVEAEEMQAEEMQAEEAEAEEDATGQVGVMGSAAPVTATVAVAAAAVPAPAPTITDAVAVAAPVAVTAAVPSLTTMMTQLRQQLDLESSAQLPQVESAAAGLGFTPDPSRNLGKRIRALWQALVL